jgi:hypothetical protein
VTHAGSGGFPWSPNNKFTTNMFLANSKINCIGKVLTATLFKDFDKTTAASRQIFMDPFFSTPDKKIAGPFATGFSQKYYSFRVWFLFKKH